MSAHTEKGLTCQVSPQAGYQIPQFALVLGLPFLTLFQACGRVTSDPAAHSPNLAHFFAFLPSQHPTENRAPLGLKQRDDGREDRTEPRTGIP